MPETATSDSIASDERMNLFTWARATPDALALVTPTHSWTYREVASQAVSLAQWLTDASIGPDTPCVAFKASASADTVLLTWTLLTLRIPFLPLHPRWTDDECQRAVQQAGAILIDASPWVLKQPHQEPLLDSYRDQPGGRPLAEEESALATVFTSGSSAIPKGVRLSWRALSAAAHASAERLHLGRADRWHLSLPVAHIGGLSILTRCLWTGSAVAIASPSQAAVSQRFDAADFLATCRAVGATLVSLVPTQLARVCEARLAPPPTLRVALIGGAALQPSLADAARGLGWPVYRSYGMTETCAQLATDVTPAADGPLTPLPGVELQLLEGRLAVRGAALFSGYLGEPVRDPDCWFVTSDLACLDSDGRVKVLGRADDVVITGGENVHPDEVEAALSEHPGVAAVCVFGRPSREWGQELCAVLVPTPTANFSPREWQQWLRGRLAPFKVPKKWALADELPVGATGKISRAETRNRWSSLCRSTEESETAEHDSTRSRP